MDEAKLFEAKISDMLEKARKGRLSVGNFMTPEQCERARAFLERERPDVEYGFFGGYPDAERMLLAFLPDYMDLSSLDTELLFRALLIRPLGYSAPDHRAYLGALMNLSVKRETVGDILVTEQGAIVFCTPVLASMLTGGSCPLERVGRERVSVEVADRSLYENYERQYETLSVIMASLRLDCAVASLSDMSRSLAKEKIIRGDVLLNHAEKLSPDAEISSGDIISVRGIGKFVIREVCGETRSGRLRVEVRRYV